MNTKTYFTNSFLETKKLAEKLAEKILIIGKKNRASSDGALILALCGELGGGKTTFVQGFSKGLGIKEKILSPTFIIMKQFQIRKNLRPNSQKFANLYHIDCYRIKKAKEILDLGFKEIISNPQNIVIIEWAERIKKILPENALIVTFKFIDKNKRKIVIGKNKPLRIY